MQEEFSTPEEYAAGFAPDRARKHCLESWFWLLLGAAQGVSLLGGFSWVRAAVTLGCLWVAWRRYHRGD